MGANEEIIVYRWFAPDDDPAATNVAVGIVDRKLVIRVWDGEHELAHYLPPHETRKLMDGLTDATTVVYDAFPPKERNP